MSLTADRELIFSRAYEHALRSAYAHGSSLTGFSFILPQPDDVITFPNGNKAYRMDTHDSGYADDELGLHNVLLCHTGAEDFPPLRIPDTFTHDTDTILESHHNDLSEIAHGLARATVHEHAMRGDAIHRVSTFTDVFETFARASFAFHEALLHATDALLNIDHPATAALLMHERFPALLKKSEDLLLAVRRLEYPDFTAVIEQGSDSQINNLLTSGCETGAEQDFFIRYVNKFSVHT